MPPRSPTIVGSAVETIVESSDASSMTSISAAKMGPSLGVELSLPTSSVAIEASIKPQLARTGHPPARMIQGETAAGLRTPTAVELPPSNYFSAGSSSARMR